MSKRDNEKKVEDPKVVDEASAPRQDEVRDSEEKRIEDAASAGKPTDPEKPIETEGSSGPAEPEKPKEPDWKTLYAVTLADFDNYKKRAARDREDVYRYAESDILKDVLPVVDNLALALANAQDKEDAFVKGVQLVYDSLIRALADHDAKPMDELVGKELDPNFHEAIATLPSAEVEEGKISNVVKTGWTLKDKLLRAAQVVVSAGKKG